MEYSTNDFDELYIEAEVRLDGKKSVPVRSRIYSHQSPQSSVNADKWKRKLHLSIGKPMRQENCFSVNERKFLLPREDGKDVHETNTLHNLEGMDRDINGVFIELSEKVSLPTRTNRDLSEIKNVSIDKINFPVCKSMKDDLNKRSYGFGLTERGRSYSILSYLLHLEQFNICRACASPINTIKTRVTGCMQTDDGIKIVPIITKNSNGILGQKSIRKNGQIIHQTYSKTHIPTYSKSVTGLVKEYADIPSHWEVFMRVGESEVQFNELYYQRNQPKLVCRLVEKKRVFASACSCWAKEYRAIELADARTLDKGGSI